MLLDERLEIVPEGSGGIHVGSPDAIRTLAQTGIPIPKNGYIYIYVSNETELWDVFFDDLRIAHRNGAIVEETHYYPFGLTMQAISSKAANRLKNSFKYNDGSELENKEFTNGSGLEWYNTNFRKYDPQLGRFNGIDALTDIVSNWSPYMFVQNNPILFNDPLGLDTVRIKGEGSHSVKIREGDILEWAIGGKISYYTYDPSNEEAVNGFVGSGIISPSEEEVVVYGSNKKNDAKQQWEVDFLSINSFFKKTSTTVAALSDIYIDKYSLSKMPKWLTGPYNRSIVMKGTKNYTNLLSVQMRRLGWQHGGRILQGVGTSVMIGTIVIENTMYYQKIVNEQPSFEEVKDHYNTPWNPVFWIWMKVENQLKELGPNKK